MNILLISSFIYLTIQQQQCQEIGVTQYNSQLRTGLLPTYLFGEIESLQIKPNKFSTQIVIQQNGWTLTSDRFEAEALIDNQIYTGVEQAGGGGGQITVQNPTILVEVAFLFSNGTIQNGQGIAVLESVSSASYTFGISYQDDPYKYTFSYVNSAITFNNAVFKAIYANFPYEIGQLQEILEELNTVKTIQQALTSFYTNTSPLSTSIQKQLKNFESLKGRTSTKVYKNGISQKYTYSITINQAVITYNPVVSYLLQAEMNIQSLKVAYSCEYPITTTQVTQANQNIEQISMDEIINTFNYAFEQNYFNTQLNSKNWKIPFFSWTTGGLNNIMTSVYTQYAYMTSISGTCNTINQAASFVSFSTQYFTLQMTFFCQVQVGQNTILNFTAGFDQIEVELDFSRVKEQASFKIKDAQPNPPNLQFFYGIADNNQQIIQWYIQEAIKNSFIGSRFFSGIIDSQRDLESQQITYEIGANGVITITNIKK